MGIDYADLLEKTQTTIRENGRSVTLVKNDNTPDDPNKPWLGSTGADTESIVTAVFGSYGSHEVDGTDVQRGDKKLLVDGNNGIDLSGYDQIKEGSNIWEIVGYDEVKPADTTLLYIVQVRQ